MIKMQKRVQKVNHEQVSVVTLNAYIFVTNHGLIGNIGPYQQNILILYRVKIAEHYPRCKRANNVVTYPLQGISCILEVATYCYII